MRSVPYRELSALTLFLWAAVSIPAVIPPAPGRIIDIGGTKLHLNCTGTGSPAVILESGFPGVSLDWVLVQPEIAKFTRVCSYDRAGFGWSSLGKQPRTGNQIADDLHELLSVAGVTPPYVLVGHSVGGIYVRIFTTKHPDQVIGMVLVDSTHEGALAYDFRSYWTPRSQAASKSTDEPPLRFPPQVDSLLGQMSRTETWKTGEQQERAAINTIMNEVPKPPMRLPMIPLLVLTAGEPLVWSDSASAGAWKHQQLQKELSTLSAQGEWMAVPGANHYIQLSKPAAVVDAIQRVVNATRALQPAHR
ncbi:MAG TPA: alpha/beta hydrolase [Bryobacteraceae bacterium]|nr:alpha/beta hydrolase [Bryobacteraceae bacterium]